MLKIRKFIGQTARFVPRTKIFIKLYFCYHSQLLSYDIEHVIWSKFCYLQVTNDWFLRVWKTKKIGKVELFNTKPIQNKRFLVKTIFTIILW